MGVGGASFTGDDSSSEEDDNEVDLLAADCCCCCCWWWCMCNMDSMLNFLAALVSASRRREAEVLCPVDAPVPDPAVLVVSVRLEGGEEAADGKAIEFIPAGNNRRGAGNLGG